MTGSLHTTNAGLWFHYSCHLLCWLLVPASDPLPNPLHSYHRRLDLINLQVCDSSWKRLSGDNFQRIHIESMKPPFNGHQDSSQNRSPIPYLCWGVQMWLLYVFLVLQHRPHLNRMMYNIFYHFDALGAFPFRTFAPLISFPCNAFLSSPAQSNYFQT